MPLKKGVQVLFPHLYKKGGPDFNTFCRLNTNACDICVSIKPCDCWILWAVVIGEMQHKPPWNSY